MKIYPVHFLQEGEHSVHKVNEHVHVQIPVSISNWQGQRYPCDIEIFVLKKKDIVTFDKGVGIPYICSYCFMSSTMIPHIVIKVFERYETKVDVDSSLTYLQPQYFVLSKILILFHSLKYWVIIDWGFIFILYLSHFNFVTYLWMCSVVIIQPWCTSALFHLFVWLTCCCFFFSCFMIVFIYLSCMTSLVQVDN